MQLLTRLTLLMALALPMPSFAQGLFSPAITVNDRVISNFEIDQRIKLLTLFRTPGNLSEMAREQLIEDRLKMQEMGQAGVALTPENRKLALEDFAGRANLTYDQFLTILNQNGVEETTLVDFVEVGVTWRDFIRLRFGSRVTITDADVDRALENAAGSGTGIEVLLSEIIIPAPPPQAQQAMATAQRISQVTSEAAFSAEARRVSALPSRSNGGRLDWVPVTNFPPALQGILLALGTGEVTAPLPITNGVALFQLRGIREVVQAAPVPASIDYAVYQIPGTPEDSLAAAVRLQQSIDTCDDLYGVAQDQPPEVLRRETLAPADIPQDIAIELARLDSDEASYSIVGAQGRSFVMLCKRVPQTDAEIDREAVRTQILGQRLSGLADGLLADLKASATITYQ